MASFREFYVTGGGASNFLASMCLWAESTPSRIRNPDVPEKYLEFTSVRTNEVSTYRQRIDRNRTQLDHVCDDEYLLSQSKRILPILKKLDSFISIISKPHSHRTDIINNVSELWKEDWSIYTHEFFEFRQDKPDVHIVLTATDLSEFNHLVTMAEDYFAKCREYYFKVCEQNEYDSFIITHNDPCDVISPRIQLPIDFRRLVMDVNDIEVYDIISKLNEIKTGFTLIDISSINIYIGDNTVSYRKIFLENDENEVMKMYDFFDNKEYFERNTTQIMKEFREYHDNNMKVIKNHMSDLYERIK